MRRNIWVYGDSWVDLPRPEEQKQRITWPFLLSHSLQSHGLRASFSTSLLGMIGCNQDWILQKLDDNDNIQPDDLVVVILTSHNRWWFFQNFPWCTNGFTFGFEHNISDEQRQACEYYFRYLHDDDLMLEYHLRRLSWLEEFQRRTLAIDNPITILSAFEVDLSGVTQNFPNLRLSRGDLYQIQREEWADPKYRKIANWDGRDLRYNHICLRNHQVLADKVAKAITYNEPVDLRHGFHQHFLYYDCYKDQQFLSQELSAAAVEEFLPYAGNVKYDPDSSFISKAMKTIHQGNNQ